MTIESGCPPHHWVIEKPDGETSNGTCLKCGEMRPFRNSTRSVSRDWRNGQWKNSQDDLAIKQPDKRQTDNRF